MIRFTPVRFLTHKNGTLKNEYLGACETLLEVKTWAALTMTPNIRAQQFQSDSEKRAHDLDSKCSGSAFTQRLKSYDKDGKYLVLVVGPFANLSDYFIVLCVMRLPRSGTCAQSNQQLEY